MALELMAITSVRFGAGPTAKEKESVERERERESEREREKFILKVNQN